MTIPHSLTTSLMLSGSTSRCSTRELTSIPPRSFLWTVNLGGSSLTLIPLLWSSDRRASTSGLVMSIIRRSRSAILTCDRTSLPRPLPSEAPLVSPGRSRTWIRAPLWFRSPGTAARVVKSYSPTRLSASVILLSRVLLPTLGNPTRATVASPDFLNPLTALPFFALLAASRNLARRALSLMMCRSVALLWGVRRSSSSISLIRSSEVVNGSPTVSLQEIVVGGRPESRDDGGSRRPLQRKLDAVGVRDDDSAPPAL